MNTIVFAAYDAVRIIIEGVICPFSAFVLGSSATFPALKHHRNFVDFCRTKGYNKKNITLPRLGNTNPRLLRWLRKI